MDEVGLRTGIDLVRRMSAIATRIHSGERLEDTLQAIADVVVQEIGFGVAAVNYRRPDGGFEMVAVAGSQECSDALLGVVITQAEMDDLLAGSEAWGGLQFVPHERGSDERTHTWTPDYVPLEVHDAWHPDDSLFAPMRDASGEVLGLLSVDLPHDGRRPGPLQRELLEVLAGQAGLAISAGLMQDQLRREHDYLLDEQARLRASEEAFRFSFEESSTGMAQVGIIGEERGRFVRVNAAIARLLGTTVEGLRGRRVVEFAIDENVDRALGAAAMAAAAGTSAPRADYRCLRADGSHTWLSISSTVIPDGSSRPPFLLVQAEDAAARVATEQRLLHDAEHDALTSLPNRRLLLHRLEGVLESARSGGPRATVMFCDLDDFKDVNDSYGHRVGDEVLEQIAGRLATVVRTDDLAGRLGGDEFVVLAEDLDDDSVASLVDRIRESVAEPLVAAPGVTVGVSVGVLTIDSNLDPALDALGVLQRVDAAMYEDKLSRRVR